MSTQFDEPSYKKFLFLSFQAYQMTSNTLPINSVPIVSPRNTSIPHPLPHHIGKNHGK